jgi:tetratricopeptide (TPR) repeat protein
VFRSGFTREAAQGVTGATLRQLLGLVDKSLLQRNVESGRFNLHELVRQLAAELLDKQGEADVTEQAHSRYYLNWMSAQKSGLEQKGALKRLRKIGRDRPNFLSAWRSAVRRADAAALLSTIPTYTLYVNMAGHDFEAHQLCLEALQQLSPGDRSFADTSDKVTYLRAVLLNTVQALGFTQVYDGEQIDLDQLYTFFQTAGDRLQTGLLCQHLAFRALRSQDIGQAMAYFQRQIDMYEQEGERFRLGVALGNLGMMALFAGQTELSQQYMARAFATLEQTDNPSYTAMVATHSGLQLMYEAHDYAAADETFARATAAGMEIWSQGLSALLLLGGLTFQGLVALIQGDLPAARQAGQQMQKLTSVRNHPTDMARSDALNGLIEATCGRYEDVNVDAFGQLPSGVERIGPIGTVLAAYGQGDVPRAVRTMIEAWSTPITLKWPALFLQYVPVAAAVLSDQGEYAQAAALIAMARQQPGCPHGWWEIMVLMQELEAKLQLALSAEEFAAAQAKGLEMDVQETATALLEQFRAMAV